MTCINWNNSSRRQQQDEDGAQKMHMRYTKRGEAFIVRNLYTHVKTDRVGSLTRRVSQVPRDKTVARLCPPRDPRECRPHSETSGRFLCDKDARCEYRSFDTHYVLSMYAHMETHLHTHIAYDPQTHI